MVLFTEFVNFNKFLMVLFTEFVNFNKFLMVLFTEFVNFNKYLNSHVLINKLRMVSFFIN